MTLNKWQHGLHPDLIKKVEATLEAMEKAGKPMRVCQALRTDTEQQLIYAQGRTIKGPDVSPTRPLGRTVTNCDGIKKRSDHQTMADGFGHAVDCCFLGDTPFPDGKHPKASWWNDFGRIAKANGLKWGGDWKSPIDRPHIYLV